MLGVGHNRRCLVPFIDIRYEANTLPRNGADEPLVFSIVADRGSSCIDAIAKCGFRNNTAVPDRSNKIIFADHALTVSNQILQQIKDLRLNGHDSAPAAQLAAASIESIIFE